MTGLFNIKPALPRYATTWDPQQVLAYLKGLPDAENLTLKLLTQTSHDYAICISSKNTDSKAIVPGQYDC